MAVHKDGSLAEETTDVESLPCSGRLRESVTFVTKADVARLRRRASCRFAHSARDTMTVTRSPACVMKSAQRGHEPLDDADNDADVTAADDDEGS
jgi:hypothetical protein